ncbi:hypothetical protein FRB97_001146 [Tulasnella sp. 331]|nr:hypothetical protein FRB97_001146 [Tulasnella sp. 331]
MAAPSKNTEPWNGVEEDELGDEEVFLDPNDILEEIQDDGDAPMDEDDEEGGAAIIEDDPEVEDNSIQHFSDHTSSVFAITAHPSQPLAASGGEDDLGYIWNVMHGELVVKLTGHTDSVSAVDWSFDGEMIATGGMDGRVRVWRRVGKVDWKNWEFVTELQGPDEVKWLKWHPKGNVLLSGSNDATVWLWQRKRIVTGDTAGTLIFWDPRSATPVWKMNAHSSRFNLPEGITSVASNSTSTVAVVGGANGELRVVNLAKGEVVAVLQGHDQGQSVEAIEFVSWSNIAAAAQEIVATGATDGKICIWDMTSMKLRATDAITSIRASPVSTGSGHHITSSSADKTLKTWDTRTGELLRDHTGHRGPVLGSAVGAFEDYVYVLSAGDDGVCFVFDAKL